MVLINFTRSCHIIGVVSKTKTRRPEDPKTHYENEDPLRKRRPITKTLKDPLFFNQTETKNR